VGGRSGGGAGERRHEQAGSMAAVARAGGQRGGSDSVWCRRVGSVESAGAQARSLLDRIHLIYDGRNWAVID
jgi:hypothetical protein